MEKIELIEKLQECTSFSELLELDCDLDTHFGVAVGDFIEYMGKDELEEWAKHIIDEQCIEVLADHLLDVDIDGDYFTFDSGWLKNIDDNDFQNMKSELLNRI